MFFNVTKKVSGREFGRITAALLKMRGTDVRNIKEVRILRDGRRERRPA